MTRPSNTLPPVDEEKTKGRTWNGYVCPGCRTVFRVAADFSGGDVMCPSCKETLRLPKTPEEARPQHPDKETPATPEPTASADPAQPARPDHPPQEPSMLGSMLATRDGRLKLSLTFLIPLALVLGAMAIFLPGKSTTRQVAQSQKSAPPVHAETRTPEKPAPPPPPVAVSEMPVPPPPSLPEVENPPVREVAVVQPVPEPEAPVAESPVAQVENPPVVPEPKSAPEIVREAPDDGLVQAIPATPVTPAPEKPAPPPASRPEPETPAPAPDTAPAASAPPAKPAAPAAAADSAPRTHTVVKGDTLERIARKYGVEARAIMQANGMKNDVVRLGRKLVIPPARP